MEELDCKPGGEKGPRSPFFCRGIGSNRSCGRPVDRVAFLPSPFSVSLSGAIIVSPLSPSAFRCESNFTRPTPVSCELRLPGERGAPHSPLGDAAPDVRAIVGLMNLHWAAYTKHPLSLSS